MEKLYIETKKFLRSKLNLEVIEMTGTEHDKQMAVVQGISHFITRGLQVINPEHSKVGTKGYEYMVNMFKMFQNDSFDLFCTLENENQYAKELRDMFIKSLLDIERELELAK